MSNRAITGGIIAGGMCIATQWLGGFDFTQRGPQYVQVIIAISIAVVVGIGIGAVTGEED